MYHLAVAQYHTYIIHLHVNSSRSDNRFNCIDSNDTNDISGYVCVRLYRATVDCIDHIGCAVTDLIASLPPIPPLLTLLDDDNNILSTQPPSPTVPTTKTTKLTEANVQPPQAPRKSSDSGQVLLTTTQIKTTNTESKAVSGCPMIPGTNRPIGIPANEFAKHENIRKRLGDFEIRFLKPRKCCGRVDGVVCCKQHNVVNGLKFFIQAPWTSEQKCNTGHLFAPALVIMTNVSADVMEVSLAPFWYPNVFGEAYSSSFEPVHYPDGN